MKKIVSILFTLCTLKSIAQTSALQHAADSILKTIALSKQPAAVCNTYIDIAKLFTGQNIEKETEYINKAIFEAEQTRDRKLIATTYRKIAEQWLGMPSNLDRQQLALTAIDKGLTIAKDAQYNKETALLLQKKGFTYRYMGKLTEAIKFHEESINYAELSNSDSVKIVTEMSYANSLLSKDENLAAFKKFMLALNLAETIHEDKLKITIYERIAYFYAKINQTEKAKDYYAKAIEQSKAIKDSVNEMYNYQNIILLYAQNKEFTVAKEYLKMLQNKVGTNETFKQFAISAELRIIYYEDEKNLPEFFKKNGEMFANFIKYGMNSENDRIKGILFTYEGKMDSALYYLNLAKKEINPNDINGLMSLNGSYAIYFQKNNKYTEAAKYLELNIPLAKQIQSLTAEKEIYTDLDSMYIKAGDKQKEVANKLLLFTIKDSLDKQQKANDLLTVEIDIENKRNERDRIAQEEKITKRNNLQYLGISAAIISLFIGLVALGRLKVKAWFIRSLGFISFILLFEFIILLIDHQLHDFTHGEPLPILLIKIVIIAFLLPLHHWLEHQVIHYLLRHEKEKEATAA
jgi:tetratricopeptide (TPR) repeat protein